MRTMPVLVSTETSAIWTPPTCSLVRPSSFGPSPVVSMPIMPSNPHAAFQVQTSLPSFQIFPPLAGGVPFFRPADEFGRSFDFGNVGRLQLLRRLIDVGEEDIDRALAELGCDVVDRRVGQRAELRVRRRTPRSVGAGIGHQAG